MFCFTFLRNRRFSRGCLQTHTIHDFVYVAVALAVVFIAVVIAAGLINGSLINVLLYLSSRASDRNVINFKLIEYQLQELLAAMKHHFNSKTRR